MKDKDLLQGELQYQIQIDGIDDIDDIKKASINPQGQFQSNLARSILKWMGEEDSIFISPKLKAQVSFSDRLSFVVRPSVRPSILRPSARPSVCP